MKSGVHKQQGTVNDMAKSRAIQLLLPDFPGSPMNSEVPIINRTTILIECPVGMISFSCLNLLLGL